MNAWTHRALGILGTALAAAAALAGAAVAADGQAPPDMLERVVARAQHAPVAVDRAAGQAIAANPVTPGVLQSAYTSALVHGTALGPDDRAGPRGPGVLSPGGSGRNADASSQGGAAWDRALAGAAATLALGVLGAIAAMAVRRRRPPRGLTPT